jgi:hypothetical protein
MPGTTRKASTSTLSCASQARSKSLRSAQRKKTDHTGWIKSNRVQSDAELQKEIQERFTKLGGVGIVSPQKAKDLCRNTTIFFSKDESAGVRGACHKKCKRWKALPCHGHHGKRAASAVFDYAMADRGTWHGKRLRPCG